MCVVPVCCKALPSVAGAAGPFSDSLGEGKMNCTTGILFRGGTVYDEGAEERAALLIRAHALIRQLPDRKLEEIMTEMEEDAWAFCT